MSTNRKQQELKSLESLLTTFNATSLGEGDTNAGGNLLAAMAVTLANIARSGSGVESPQTCRTRVGTNLLVSGGLSTSLVRDAVVTEAAVRQNNLLAQVRRLIGDKIADAKKEGSRMIEFPTGPCANYSGNALYQLEHSDPFAFDDLVETWREVIDLPPNPRIDDLAARPKILVTARSPHDLEKQLIGLHDNRPLVVLGLHSPTDATALSDTCAALLDGLYPCGDSGETASGNLLVTDSCDVLRKIAPNASEKSTWLGRMVWLVDGDTGPDATDTGAGEGEIRGADMLGRFGEALSTAFARRLNNHDASPTVHHMDLTVARIRWTRFLQSMENRLPGISGTARSLLPSLAFGLIELADALPRQRLSVTPVQVEALARWIIRRMANARVAMLGTAEREWRLQLARRIQSKLAGGDMGNREIYRSIGIGAALCDEVLLEMRAAGLVRRQEHKWGSTRDGTLQKSDEQNLFIEV